MDKGRILLAEDNRVSQRVVQAMLEHLGFQTVICDNGTSAVQACLAGHYSAVLMDGFMPEMDGFEAAREIRRLERGRRTPIIALTGGSAYHDRQRCLEAGMDDYLTKPVRPDDLASALAKQTGG
jgi:two-component system, sensor histidine kinase and response regulator